MSMGSHGYGRSQRADGFYGLISLSLSSASTNRFPSRRLDLVAALSKIQCQTSHSLGQWWTF